MSKQGSQVAFIPDNISNISSQKQRYNEDTSHKIQESYISKLTKLQNNNIDLASNLQSAEPKNIPQIRLQQKQLELKDHLEEIPKDNISIFSKKVIFKDQYAQKIPEKRLIIHRFVKQVQDPYSNLQKRQQHAESDNTYLYGKRTQTDVISQKQSFVQEEEQNQNNQNYQKRKINDLILNGDLILQKFNKNYVEPQQTYNNYQNEQMIITHIQTFDEFQTQKGWLEHQVNANHKFLYIQTNKLFNLNKIALMEIQKVQLRTKIIQLELQTNKLKIALRKSQSSKHINFSLDLKFNRITFLKIPKKIDTDLRKYCFQLQTKVNKLRKHDEQNSKQLSLLQFYQKDFLNKVNYAYIYQQYLIDKAKKELGNAVVYNLKSSKEFKSPSKSKVINLKSLQKSLQSNKIKMKTQKVILQSNAENSQINKSPTKSQQDKFDTSLAFKVDKVAKDLQIKTPKKLSLEDKFLSQRNFFTSPRNKNKQNFQSEADSSYNYYYNQNLNKLTYNPSKKINLTHHKELSQPYNKKYVTVSSSQNINPHQNLIPLFNTPNRQKKHFYYQCQQYLRQLENNYLFNCQEEKQQNLLQKNNLVGFRQRQFLKMKLTNAKNQILNCEVDAIQKQRQLNKQNQIIKKQLKLIEDKIFNKFGNIQSFSNNLSKQKSPFNKLRSISRSKSPLDNYGLLFRKAENRLKIIKSSTKLQNLSPTKLPKSPRKKLQSQQTIQSLNNNIKNEKMISKAISRNTQNSDVKTLKKSPAKQNKPNRSQSAKKKQHIVSKVIHQKSNKFLKRFKKSTSEASGQNDINQTIKQRQDYSQQIGVKNPQKGQLLIGRQGTSNAQTEIIQKEYYTLGQTLIGE